MKPFNRLFSILAALIWLALPSTGIAATLHTSNGTNLTMIDTTTGAQVVVGPFTAGSHSPLAATSDGRLWSFDDFWQALASVDPVTGAATLVGPIQQTPLSMIVAMAAGANGVMYAYDDRCQFFRIDLLTGAETPVAGSCGLNVADMDFDSAGTLYLLANDTVSNYLMTINPANGSITGSITLTGPMPAVSGGFAIDKYSDTGYFVNINGSLYTVDLQLGTTALIGATGGAWGATFVPTGITLGLNQPGSVYRAGDTLTLTATTTAGPYPATVDLWIRLALPGGSYRYLTAAGTLSSTPAPVLVNWPVATLSRSVFSHTFSGTEPLGNFTWQAALTQPGTQNYVGRPDTAPFSHQLPLTPGKLVINEVDYDDAAIDTTEFVEIFNAGGTTVDLTGVVLSFIDGATMTEYLNQPLNIFGTLAPGQYIVVSDIGVIVDPTAFLALFPMDFDNIQDGVPDGIALLDTVNGVVLDALSYGGSITAATSPLMPAPFSLVEGTPTPLTDTPGIVASLIRSPNGTDTDNAATDWSFTTLPTPGSANVLQ